MVVNSGTQHDAMRGNDRLMHELTDQRLAAQRVYHQLFLIKREGTPGMFGPQVAI